MPSKAQDYGYAIKDGWLYNGEGGRIRLGDISGEGWQKYMHSGTVSKDRMGAAIILVQRLKKEYDIKDDHVEGLFTILYDVARFGYAGDDKA
tara:strand:- start:953 stop:1228 length:276 start_codon:yes stop_codon:yes gene_type:complete